MTALTRWDPFRELEEMSERLSNVLGGRRDLPRIDGGTREAMRLADWRPVVDIEETEDECLIKAELPEVKKEDVRISLQEGVLTIQGERSQEKETKDRRVHRTERFYGNFMRTFLLPDDVEPDGVKAEFKDGMLYVRLKKSEKAKPRAIDIQVD
jgi:HSP20 family protein